MHLPWILRTAALLFAVASAGAVDDSVLVDTQLVYTTTSSCSTLSVNSIPESDLVAYLLPYANFQGKLYLTTEAASIGCALQLLIQGTVAPSTSSLESTWVKNVFDVAYTVDAKMADLVANPYLRGGLRLKDLTLARVDVKVDNKKEYELVLDASLSTTATTPYSQIAVSDSTTCNMAGLTSEGLLHAILPTGVDAGQVGEVIVPSTDRDNESNRCALSLDIVGHTHDGIGGNPFSYFHLIDTQMNAFLDEHQPNTQLLSAHVKILALPLSSTASTLSTQNLETIAKPSPIWNGPTKGITFGLLGMLTVLGAMMAAVMYKKGTHEKQCREQYNKASHAAQIRRVSIRMAHEQVPVEDEESFGEEDEHEGLL